VLTNSALEAVVMPDCLAPARTKQIRPDASTLRSYHSHKLHIVTDSRFVLGLVRGGLLAMERDGWPDTPLSCHWAPASSRPMFKYLLYLLRRRNASIDFSWIKGHSGVEENEIADILAKKGVETDLYTLDVSTLFTPRGWVDETPVLNHQSLSHLTYLVVRDQVTNPLLGPKFDVFREEWSAWMGEVFLQDVDLTRAFRMIWKINVPKGLKELLWKESSGSLPLGAHWHGKSPLGNECRCGRETTLTHIWEGCVCYNMWPLKEVMLDSLPVLGVGGHRVLDVAAWPPPFWFPLLCLKQLEKPLNLSKKERRALKNSRATREKIVGTYLWSVWRWRIKEIMDESFSFVPSYFVESLRKELGVG